MVKRRKFTAQFKARVVLQMFLDGKSLDRASRDYGIKNSVLYRWGQNFSKRSPKVFETPNDRSDRDEGIARLEMFARSHGYGSLES
ncbi:MAG: transposase [Chloroflexi bacterium]|nr:transposase [Chloroflexota bacterium]